MLSAGGFMAINENYVGTENKKKIKEIFLKEKKVILFQFFKDDYYQQLKKEIKRLKFEQEKHYLTHCHRHAALSPHFQEKFRFKELVWFIENLTNKKTSSWKPRILQFSWKDYTILHDQNKEKPGIDIILDFTADWNSNAEGAITYVDGTGNYTQIPIQGNMLAIVKRTKNEQRFVQYVNYYAGKKSRYFILETLSNEKYK